MEVKLVVANGKQAGQVIAVNSAKFIIGRNEDCQLRPQSHLVSRKHCAILTEEDSAILEDLGSTNGTFVNGEKLEGRRKLKGGDRIKVGLLEVDVRLDTAAGEKPKPKIQNVQQAAVRTAALTGASEDDLDVSRWLGDDDDALNVPPPAKKPAVGDETVAGTSLVDTTSMPVASAVQQTAFAPQQEEEKDKKAPAKTVGKVNHPAKPTTNNSGAAADDALRHFFHRKK
jgi:predicted component of type VI protein secretion system